MRFLVSFACFIAPLLSLVAHKLVPPLTPYTAFIYLNFRNLQKVFLYHVPRKDSITLR
jgi:hypothetical protein